MKFHVAYDQDGRILAASTEDGDKPDAMPGVTVAEFDVPAEFAKAKPDEFFHQLHVDVRQRKLVKR